MLAYNKQSLDNWFIERESLIALRRKLISDEEYTGIVARHSYKLYTPNIFIRIGLFLATGMCVTAGFGMLTLLFQFTRGVDIILPFYSVFLYASLEWFVNKTKHFHSGVDDALLWASMGFILGTVNYFDSHLSSLGESVLVLVLSAFATLRFANWVMAGVMVLSFFAMIFYGLTPLGAIEKTVLPFLIMIVSFLIYWVTKKNQNTSVLRHYASCLLVIEVIALISIYSSVNYFIVRELSVAMFGLQLPAGATITGGWFFWAATLLLPPVYVFLSLKNKDAVLLRVGLLLGVATILTIRYYYSFAPVEVLMTVGGAALIVLAYVVTRYLKMPRHGITSEQSEDVYTDVPQLEGIVIAETFHQSPAPASDGGFQFGGGSGGGGGASGQY
jgi:hypothetical protein